MLKAKNSSTGTVHYAHTDGTGLVQDCGIKANQHCYLTPVDDSTEVTCGKCPSKAPRKTAKVERKTFGRQEWSLTELREMAKELGVSGRTTKDGAVLLAEISAKMPNVD